MKKYVVEDYSSLTEKLRPRVYVTKSIKCDGDKVEAWEMSFVCSNGWIADFYNWRLPGSVDETTYDWLIITNGTDRFSPYAINISKADKTTSFLSGLKKGDFVFGTAVFSGELEKFGGNDVYDLECGNSPEPSIDWYCIWIENKLLKSGDYVYHLFFGESKYKDDNLYPNATREEIEREIVPQKSLYQEMFNKVLESVSPTSGL